MRRRLLDLSGALSAAGRTLAGAPELLNSFEMLLEAYKACRKRSIL